MISKIKEHINRKYSNGYKINYLGMLSILVEALAITISFYILVVNFSSFTLLNVFMLDNKMFILSGSAVFLFMMFILLITEIIEFKLWKIKSKENGKTITNTMEVKTVIYTIEITEMLQLQIKIEAISEDEAIKSAREKYNYGEIIINEDNLVDVEFEIISR